MSGLHSQITSGIKDAMRAKDKVKLATLRDAKSKFMLEQSKTGATENLSDKEAIKIISKLYKQRLETAEARIRDSEDEVFGELRVTTTTGFGTLWLAPRINRLYEQYPDLNIDLILEERVLDLPMREADVAIRMKEPSQADLVRRRLMNVKMRLYATQKYLDKYGTPTSLEELDVHRLVTQGLEARQVNESIAWFKPILEHNHGSNLTMNNYFGVLQAVLHDTGIGVLPDYVSDEVPELVRVLPDDQSKEIPVFLAFPEELRHSKRVQAFRDFVLEEIKTHRLHKSENV